MSPLSGLEISDILQNPKVHYRVNNRQPQGCRNPGRQVVVLTKFCTVASHNICWSSEWNLLHVTFLASRILRCLLDFWRICAALIRPTLNHIRSSYFCSIHLRYRSPHVHLRIPRNVFVSDSRINFLMHFPSFIPFQNLFRI